MKKFLLAFTICIVFISSTIARELPNIRIIATGGTIAGAGTSATETNYVSATVGVDALINAVPQIRDIANVTGEQFVKVGSQDMTDVIWLGLTKHLNTLLQDPNIDGVVITHGTDTMEETAYFLTLTVKSCKPIVIVGAMRPSTSLSADGPLNLYNAVVVASDTASQNKGVMIVMNGSILAAESAIKMNTVDVQTFQAPNSGALGYVLNGKVRYNIQNLKKNTVNSIFDVSDLDSLPKVGIVYGYSNVEPCTINTLVDNNYKGIVVAGVGNGNIHCNLFPSLENARKSGLQIVRSSRVPTGPVTLDNEVDDAKYEFIASIEHNPQKSRVLLMLALTQTSDYQTIQKYFFEY